MLGGGSYRGHSASLEDVIDYLDGPPAKAPRKKPAAKNAAKPKKAAKKKLMVVRKRRVT